MSESYQRRVERRLRDGDVAVVSMGRSKTGYIYHRGSRYWWVTVRGEDYESVEERGCPAYRRSRLFDEHSVRAVDPARVPRPIDALSRAEPVEDVEDGQQRLDEV